MLEREALIREMQAAVGSEKVISEREQLRTYECDGLSQYRCIPDARRAAGVDRGGAGGGPGLPPRRRAVRGPRLGHGPVGRRAAGRGRRADRALAHAAGSSRSTSRTSGSSSSRASSTCTSPRRSPATATTTRPTRRASSSARSAATSPRTPAARTASSTASPRTTCSGSRSCCPTARSSTSAARRRTPRATTSLGVFVGSEGTLGIATKVTLRLVRRPEAVQTLLAAFPSTDEAGDAVSGIIAAGIVPGRDRDDGPRSRSRPPRPRSTPAIRDCGRDADRRARRPGSRGRRTSSSEIEKICRACASGEIRIAADDEERALIWKGRKAAFAAMGRISPELHRPGRRHPAHRAARGPAPRSTSWPPSAACGSPTSSTPATATCTRWCCTTPERGRGRARRGDRPGHPRHLRRRTAARSPASTASARTRRPTCRGCSPRTTSRSCSSCAAPSTREHRCNPGKVFPTPRLCGEVPGPYREHPAQKAGLAELF